MRTYNVLVTPDAYGDLAGIRDYIAQGLGSPEDARSALHSIRMTIASLATMPSRGRKVEREPWRSRDVRRILSGRLFVFYRVDEDAGTVYVLNVIHARGAQRTYL